jgi:hypothetical protein
MVSVIRPKSNLERTSRKNSISFEQEDNEEEPESEIEAGI